MTKIGVADRSNTYYPHLAILLKITDPDSNFNPLNDSIFVTMGSIVNHLIWGAYKARYPD